ncbi:cell polarity protein-like protein [Phyllosticta citrichinensis]|uniref:Cell polarity protein-like protein n=1 Tax=Phyllosticta citrichinensis TaxID=1130410 RepID=A0ABR1XSZ9_9PEZI
MAGHSPVSPISVENATAWSPPSKNLFAGAIDNPYSPSILPTPRNQLATPPASIHTTISNEGGMPNGLPRPNGQPSPPSSIARSSDGGGLYARSLRDRESITSRKALMLEESLSDHYRMLKSYLAPYLRDEKGNLRPNRARDKLLRLSPVQFQELSTDVYDESIRREDERRKGGSNNPNNDTPKFLPPKSNYHPKRNQARQKLSTLPIERFRQLATDVFYELERRFPHFVDRVDLSVPGSPTGSVASSRGPGRRGTPSSGSMGRGPPPPGYRGPPPGPRGPGRGPPGPMPKQSQSQSNTIVPTKSTLVEDDDDPSGIDDDDEDHDAFGLEDAVRRSSRRTSGRKSAAAQDDKVVADLNLEIIQLKEKFEELELKLNDRDAEIEKLKSEEKDGDTDLNKNAPDDDMENKLSHAQEVNDSLRIELEQVKADSEAKARELQAQLDKLEQNRGAENDNDWKQRYELLEVDFEEQQKATEEVRREAFQFLQEMRSLSERSTYHLEREERLQNQVSQLEAEIKEWKSRFARAKAQVRHLRASSASTNFTQDASVHTKDGGIIDPAGMVKDVHVTKFQLSIDQLLQTARKADPQDVVECMKDVVSCVRTITADVEVGYHSSGGESDDEGHAKKQQKLKSRVSATASNLITASQNHAASAGLSPVSLLDAAASHLTTSVVELIKTVKIRPTQPGEEDYEVVEARPTHSSKNYYGMANGRHSRHASAVSIDSTRYSRSVTGSPRPWSSRKSEGPNGHLNGSIPIVKETSGLEEIKTYLQDQTTGLVNSIQPLVQEIRTAPSNGPLPQSNIDTYVNDISRTVYEISYKTREAIENVHNPALSKHAKPVVELLEDSREGLVQASGDNEGIQREKIPPLAFKIARATKELVIRVERIDNRELTEDMSVSNDF